MGPGGSITHTLYRHMTSLAHTTAGGGEGRGGREKEKKKKKKRRAELPECKRQKNPT